MAAVKEFTLPDLGEGLTEAEIVRWLVEIGDVVAVDQPVVEVETAKALVEVPCPYGGVVTACFGAPGDQIPVGSALVTVAVGEADAAPAGSQDDSNSGPDGSRRGGSRPGDSGSGDLGSGDLGSGDLGSGDLGSGNVLVGYGTTASATGRRRRVGQPVAPPTEAAQARPVHLVADAPYGLPHAVAAGGPVAMISPLVRRMAREHGLDLRTLRGSGPEGLILRMDVERAIMAQAASQPAPAPATDTIAVPPNSGGDGLFGDDSIGDGFASVGSVAESSRIPLRGVRAAVAAKLARSRQEIPDATCWVDADATELLAARAAMNAAAGPHAPKVSVLAMFARICTAALGRYPELNSTVDTERQEIVRFSEVRLGFAAQTERGLVVPVIRGAHRRATEALAVEIARLTEAARAGALTPAELTQGTFTLNNYGVFGVDGSTPIINHPEAAMLGVGRITPKPWVHEGALAVRQVVQLSLTFDHRVCDGGTAGGFLRFVADCVEQPAVLLRSV